ncbi:MAG: hypothetical protein ACLTFB_02475 [Candidatus Phytoplasma pyri]
MAPYQNKFNIQEKQFYDVQLPQITSEFLNTNYPIRYEILDKNIDPQKTKIEVNATYSKIINKFNQNDELVVKEYYVKTLNFEQLIRFNEYYQANKFKKIITYYHMDDNYMMFNVNPNDPKTKPKLEITEYNRYNQRQDTKYNRQGQIISIKPPVYEPPKVKN